jgi:hypothetical protein
MDCPRCKLTNPGTAQRCDCGYDFETKTVERPYFTTEPTRIGGHAPVQRGDWIEITIPNRALTFPAMCPTCLKSNPDSSVSIRSEKEDFAGYRVAYTKHRYLRVTVPHCGGCARHFLLWQRISRISIVLGLFLGVLILLKFDLPGWMGWVLVVPLAGPGIWASMYLNRSIRLVYFDEQWLRFRLRSMEYAKQFQALNCG